MADIAIDPHFAAREMVLRLAAGFENVVVTQDWHTPGHASFASSHMGKKPFETTKLAYGTQVLWPDHCVLGTADAAFLPAVGVYLTACRWAYPALVR